MASQQLPEFPFAREHGYNPSPLNAKLRHEDPVSKVKLYDGSQAWIITKHEDCCEILDSSKLSADRRSHGYPEIHPGGHKAKHAKPTFINLDDPDHDKQRRMLESEFTPETVNKKWRPIMEHTVDIILDKFIQKGRDQQPIDFMEEFANIVPPQVIYKVLGAPEKDVERLSKDSELRNTTARDAAESANKELNDYMKDLVKQKIQQPRDDVISKLVVEQYKSGNLSEGDITTLAFLVLTAGNAALINSIGLGTLTLMQHPSQLVQFKKNPSMAAQIVNEITRYHTISALNSRRAATENMDIRGKQVKKGEGVICSVQAGNRDEDKFSDPETFDIRRHFDKEDSLGFGYGPHRCQGEAISRVELEIVFTKLFQKLPSLRLAKSPMNFIPPGAKHLKGSTLFTSKSLRPP
ncbi:hypothetical protein WHR41_09339 [Cladosporium halotolerans]|uniref:Cytochrome P450 n=1 Tax=Cladosporium halotolerans TaxID=1052096 RepID=A0AB34KAM5_9PEZI